MSVKERFTLHSVTSKETIEFHHPHGCPLYGHDTSKDSQEYFLASLQSSSSSFRGNHCSSRKAKKWSHECSLFGRLLLLLAWKLLISKDCMKLLSHCDSACSFFMTPNKASSTSSYASSQGYFHLLLFLNSFSSVRLFSKGLTTVA